MPALTAPDTPLPVVTTSEFSSVFLGVNPWKAMGPDGVLSRSLRSRKDQLAEVFTDIFNPVPEKTHAVCLNDYHPVALTSTNMKCFERLVMAHINSSLPTCLDPLQFAYCHNRSTVDAISLASHSSLEHLD
eukprot:g12500.t1